MKTKSSFRKFQNYRAHSLLHDFSSSVCSSDISPDGLAFTYIPDDDQAKEPGEITLFVSGKTYRLDNLPIIKSFDRELKNNPSIFSTVPLRRYGVQFVKMDTKARSQLNFFISHFTL